MRAWLTILLAVALLIGGTAAVLGDAAVTQFAYGGSSAGSLIITTNNLAAVSKTAVTLFPLSGWFGQAALYFSGVYPSAAVTNDVIVLVDTSLDSNVWKNAVIVWTNSVQGLTTNQAVRTLNLDGVGFCRVTITNTAAATTCNAVSLWASYAPKSLN